MKRPDFGNIPKADKRQYFAPDEPEHLDAYLGRDGGDALEWVSLHPEVFNALPELLDIAERAMIGEHEADESGRPCLCSQCSLTRDARAALTKAGYQF